MPDSNAKDSNAAEHDTGDAGPAQIWVVSDGTAGMRLQAVALADALRRARSDWNCEEYSVSPHAVVRLLPRLAACMPGLPLYATRTGQLQRRPHSGKFPDILILSLIHI